MHRYQIWGIWKFSGATLCFSVFFPVIFYGSFYNDVQQFLKLPKDKQQSKWRTDIKFDVSESFSGATLCFSLLFQNFFSPWFLHILHFLWSPIIDTIYWTTHRHQIMDIKCLKIHTLQLAINDYQATEMGSLKKHKESVHMGVR